MAQGSTKNLKSKSPSGGRKKSGLTKKGKRDIAPKNKQRVEERAHKKVYTSLQSPSWTSKSSECAAALVGLSAVDLG